MDPSSGSSSSNLGATECFPHRHSKRNLVICLDGTANHFSVKNTNVVELYSRLKKDRTQLTYYNSGVGTSAKARGQAQVNWPRTALELAFAQNFQKIVLDAYRWLSNNYKPGDCISLFGFSRGAYQVRILSGMIEQVGLIQKGNEPQIPFAWEVYRKSGISSGREKAAKEFKKTFCYLDVRIHFVGVWDTVSSIGLKRSKLDYPLVASGMKHVCFFRHALALDERRVKFLPEYVGGGAGPTEKDVTNSRGMPRVKEVWFAGTHSDIGGGSTENSELSNNGPALRWMVNEARKLGIRIDPCNRYWANNVLNKAIVNESLTGCWWLLECCPFTRLSYSSPENPSKTIHSFHRGHRRQPVKRQLIHQSVYDHDLTSEDYRSKLQPNLQKGSPDFGSEQDDEELATLAIAKAITKLGGLPTGEHVKEIRDLDRYMSGKYKRVIDDLCNGLFRDKDDHSSGARVAMEILVHLHQIIRADDHDSSGRVECSKLPSVLATMVKDPEYWEKAAREFIDKYSCRLFADSDFLSGGPIKSIAFSNDSKHVTACSPVIATLPIFKVSDFGKLDESRLLNLEVHEVSALLCVAFSPSVTQRPPSRDTASSPPPKDIASSPAMPEEFIAFACKEGVYVREAEHLAIEQEPATRSGDSDFGKLKENTGQSTSLKFSPDGRRLLFSTLESIDSVLMTTLMIYERQPTAQEGSTAPQAFWKRVGSFQPKDATISQATFFSADGEHILICADRPIPSVSILYLVDKSGNLIGQADANGIPSAITFSGGRIYVGHVGGLIEIKTLELGVEANTLETLGSRKLLAKPDITSLAVSPDGKRLLCGTTKGAVILETENTLQQLDWNLVQNAEVCSVAWSPDGNWFAVGTAKGYLFLYDGTHDHRYTLQALEKAANRARDEASTATTEERRRNWVKSAWQKVLPGWMTGSGSTVAEIKAATPP